MHCRAISFVGAQGFMNGHEAELAPVNASGMRQQFDATVAEIHAQGVRQATSEARAHEEVKNVRELRRTLFVDHLRPLIALAKAIPQANTPVPDSEVASKRTLFRLELPDARELTPALVAHAIEIAGTAQLHEEVLLKLGARSGFIDRLRETADRLAHAHTDVFDQKESRKSSTAAIDGLIKKARVELKALTELIRDHAREHDRLLTDWSKAIQLQPHRPRALGSGASRRTAQLAGPTARQITSGQSAPEVLPPDADGPSPADDPPPTA
jgi:hypothetical protein